MHFRPCVIIAWLQISSEPTATLKRTGGCFFFSDLQHVLYHAGQLGIVSGTIPEEIVADRMVSVSLLGLEMSAILCLPCNQRRGICSSSGVKRLRLVGVKSEQCRKRQRWADWAHRRLEA